MDIKIDFDFNIEEDEIIRLLGYKGSEPNEEILCSIRGEIKACKTYIKPQVWSKKILINNIEKDKVILDNSIVLEGEFIANKLKGCSYIVATISTIGIEIDKVIKDAFDEDDYLKGMIIDNIGTTCLGYTNKVCWNSLVDSLKHTNIGITQRLSPGDTAWPVAQQKNIFDNFKEIGIGVQLLESSLMIPLKSTSAIFGFGEGIGITKLEHICSECSMQSCNYRMDKSIEVVVNTDKKQVIINAFKGQNLLKALVENNIFIQNPCNGKGTCGKCRVLITKGIEKSCKSCHGHLSDLDLEKGLRLACVFKIQNDMELSILSTEDSIDVLTKGQELKININPIFQKNSIKLAPPNINDQRDDLARLKDGLNNLVDGSQFNDIKIGIKILSNLSQIIRKDDFNVTACTYKNTLVGLESGDTSNMFYGIAMDVGTTTIACYLINMINGETIDITSEVNKQRNYGADVISRINYTIENAEGIEVLKNSIINQINEMVEVLCSKNKVSKNSICNMTIAGNTIMLQMLLGISCRNISMAPYTPVFTENIDFKGEEIGINIGGIVSLLPGISGYVGSDITAGILASGMAESEKYSILLDLGTNGELALGNIKGIVACSTAAGPAFEGANIKYGIGGVMGAISKIEISPSLTVSGEKIYKTIGDKLPIGICGSGVLDAVSELLKYGVIDETGRMLDADEIDNVEISSRVVVIDQMKQFLIEKSSENNNSIYFTQKDVREVQLAKAAISAGIKILISEKGISFNEIEKVYIAGGFGNFMNINSTINIGMLPKELEGKIYSIGNSAGSGARMYLLSQEQREKALQIKKSTTYIELSTRADFQDYFMDAIMF